MCCISGVSHIGDCDCFKTCLADIISVKSILVPEKNEMKITKLTFYLNAVSPADKVLVSFHSWLDLV